MRPQIYFCSLYYGTDIREEPVNIDRFALCPAAASTI
jgi:hypothetical protein